MPRYENTYSPCDDCQYNYSSNGQDMGMCEMCEFNQLLKADVVPRSEVERLTVELEAMRGAANSYKLHYEKAKQEVAEKIFAELDNGVEGMVRVESLPGSRYTYDEARLLVSNGQYTFRIGAKIRIKVSAVHGDKVAFDIVE